MDFVILNVLGIGLYSVFNIEMFFKSSMQSDYLFLHPDGVLPVQLNDVVFSVHALLAVWPSVGNILLDLSGGLASLLRMVLVADNSQDWTSLPGDLAKLGLFLLPTLCPLQEQGY